jgi:hypothetical protein
MIIDLNDKLQEKRIENNNLKNERYLIRNEAVKLLNFICQFNLTKHELEGLKSGLLDNICKLNTQIAKDTGNDYSKISPYYPEE